MAEPNRPRTVLESDDEIRAALQKSPSTPEITVRGPRSAVRRPPPPPAEEILELDPVSDVAPQSRTRGTAKSYRPTLRPPVPLLTVLDDGSNTGEVIRLRNERFVIGRNEGDLQLPHDGLISGRHLEIIRVFSDGRYRWLIADLKSTHGAYFRYSSHRLTDRTEFLCGRSRFRFLHAARAADSATAVPRTDRTVGWDAVAESSTPTLVELIRDAPNQSVPVTGEAWIGADPTCALHPKDDPFLEPRHARVYQHRQRGWLLENNDTTNGVWVRKQQHVLDPASPTHGASIRFQLGEQQFKLTVTA